MTADEIVGLLRDANFKVTALHETVVTGERPIPGHPGWYRAVAVTGFERDWHGVMYLKRPKARNLVEWEYDPEPLGERSCIASPEHFGLWLGGTCSVPVDVTEHTAIHGA